MNKIILLGNMTRNPKTTRKTAEDGNEVVITKFDLAVNRRSKRDGESDADFFHCTSFGKQAEFVERYFHNGSRVLVIGRVQNNNYTTREGSKVYGFSIITEEVEFAQKKSAEKVHNHKAYMLTVLYQAKSQGELDISNQVMYDFYGAGSHEKDSGAG